MTTTLNKFDELNDLLTEIEETVRDSISYREPLALHLQELEPAHQFLFDQEVSPAGDAWPDIKEETKRRKGRDDILVDTERLMRSLTGQTSDSVREIYKRGNKGWTSLFGTEVEYSRRHQEGLGIEQREHVGTGEKLVDQLTEDLTNWTIAELQRAGSSPSSDLFS